MVTTPEQFLQIQKVALEAFQSASIASLDGFERLAALHVQAARASIGESADTLKSLAELKEPKQFAEYANGSVEPATEKVASYYRNVYEIASETGNEIARAFEQQLAEGQRQWNATIDTLARSAPAGSEGVVALARQAMSAANSAFEQAGKAARQAAEVAEANLGAVPRAAAKTRARKAA